MSFEPFAILGFFKGLFFFTKKEAVPLTLHKHKFPRFGGWTALPNSVGFYSYRIARLTGAVKFFSRFFSY